MNERDEHEQRVTFWSIVRSILAAAIGVQKRANRVRDFQHGRPGQFIFAGAVFTLLFVVVLVTVVYAVIRVTAS